MSDVHQKIEFHPFEDEKFETAKGKPFIVQINPINYKRSHKINYSKKEGTGNNSKALQYDGHAPEVIDLTFTLDGTGAVEKEKEAAKQIGRDEDYVNDRIKELKDKLFNYDGENHQPPFIAINWGGTYEMFKGILSSLDIQYKLFWTNGKPLRAEITMKFDEFTSLEVKEKENNTSSPDLTHERTVVAGDSLQILTRNVYGDPKYYLEVARVNNLENFRSIPNGTVLYFPPIEKLKKA